MLEWHCNMACALNKIVYDTQLEARSWSEARDAVHDRPSPQDTNSTAKSISISAKTVDRMSQYTVENVLRWLEHSEFTSQNG